MIVWAVRDILRRPTDAGLQAVSLTVLVGIVGTVLMLSQGLSDTARNILSRGPDLVIRRIDAGGWEPVPVQAALQIVKQVPGVLNPRARIWGTVRGESRVYTVIGIDEQMEEFLAKHGVAAPSRGQAVAGGGVIGEAQSSEVVVAGQERRKLSVVSRMPEQMDMVAHDVILVHPEDARELLGIPEGFASDLALDVFHEQEAAAVIPELSDAFPWAVHIISRKESMGGYLGGYARRSSISLMAAIPAILALLLLMIVTIRDGLGRKAEVGLLKAVGWTSRDILRLQFLKSSVLAFPCTLVGLAAAYALVFWPGTNWAGFLFFGWRQTAPPLFLDASGAGLVMVQISAWILVPYFLASLWASFKGAVADPMDLIDEGDTRY